MVGETKLKPLTEMEQAGVTVLYKYKHIQYIVYTHMLFPRLKIRSV